MKPNIHPAWFPESVVTCACGNTWVTGATVEKVRTDICSACHPFYTGEQRIVDTEGQVDRFMKRLQVRDTIRAEKQEREVSHEPENIAIIDFGLERKVSTLLAENGIENAGQLLTFLSEKGEGALLEIPGIGRKIVADLKKGLRSRGFELPKIEAAE